MIKFAIKLAPLCAAAMLTGCSLLEPLNLPGTAASTQTRAIQKTTDMDGWDAPAINKNGQASVVLITPTMAPKDELNKKVSFQLEPGAKVVDIVAVLARLGHSVVLSDPEAGEKSFYMPRYHGTLGGFLSVLSKATDTWFTWHDGTIMVSSKEKITVTIPQEEDFAESLSKGLQGMGVENSAISWQAGMATVSLSPSELRRVKTYLTRITNNAAVVSLQVAVISVTLDQNARQGIDWEGLNIAVGKGAGSVNPSLFDKTETDIYGNAVAPGASTGAEAGTGTGTGTGAVAEAVEKLAPVSSLLVSGGALKGLITKNSFSLSAMVDFLQKYGVTQTQQNAKLSTVAGREVVLKSLTQVPYVAEITNSATTNTSNTTNTGSARTEKADDGIEIKLTPTYDASSSTVTINFDLSLKSVIAFNELKAGNQLGTITQPTTSERSFTDLIKVRPGQTMVIGGLSYDQVSDNRGGPVFLTPGSSAESQALKVSKQSMFVVIRPVVEVLGTPLIEKQAEPEPNVVPPEHENEIEAEGSAGV